VQLVVGFALLGLVVIGAILAARWFLRVGDLEPFAVPNGFEVVSSDEVCGGAGGNTCSRRWILVSDSEQFADAASTAELAFSERGWVFGRCDDGTCYHAQRGESERCLAFTDVKNSRLVESEVALLARFEHHDTVIRVSDFCG
jgi:hypothetical protein